MTEEELMEVTTMGIVKGDKRVRTQREVSDRRWSVVRFLTCSCSWRVNSKLSWTFSAQWRMGARRSYRSTRPSTCALQCRICASAFTIYTSGNRQVLNWAWFLVLSKTRSTRKQLLISWSDTSIYCYFPCGWKKSSIKLMRCALNRWMITFDWFRRSK